MTMGVQLDVDARVRELLHFLPVHQLKDALGAKLLVVNL